MIETTIRPTNATVNKNSSSPNSSFSSTLTVDDLPKAPILFESSQEFDDQKEPEATPYPSGTRNVSFDLSKNTTYDLPRVCASLTWYSRDEQTRFKNHTNSMVSKANKLMEKQEQQKRAEGKLRASKIRTSFLKSGIRKSIQLGNKNKLQDNKKHKKDEPEAPMHFGEILQELYNECERCELGERLRMSSDRRKRFESLYQKHITSFGIEFIGLQNWVECIKDDVHEKRETLQLTVEEVQADCDNEFIPNANREEEIMLQSAYFTHSSQLFAHWIAKAQYAAR